MPLEAVRTVSADDASVCTVEIKRHVRVDKVPGGEINYSRVLSSVMLDKDIAHPEMHRRILKPHIVLLNCPLEYKNSESRRMLRYRKGRILRDSIESRRAKSM